MVFARQLLRLLALAAPLITASAHGADGEWTVAFDRPTQRLHVEATAVDRRELLAQIGKITAVEITGGGSITDLRPITAHFAGKPLDAALAELLSGISHAVIQQDGRVRKIVLLPAGSEAATLSSASHGARHPRHMPDTTPRRQARIRERMAQAREEAAGRKRMREMRRSALKQEKSEQHTTSFR